MSSPTPPSLEVEASVPAVVDRDLSESEHDVARRGLSSWARVNNTALTFVAACISPAIYIGYLWHFAVDVPFVDDWFNVRVGTAAVSGHLSLSMLWQQYNTSRIFLGRLVIILFALTDRLDLRAVIIFNGIIMVATYGLLLAMFRRYSGGHLNPLSVLVIGLLWLSLADVGNSLWSFQLAWYLGLFLFMAMLSALILPRDRTWRWFAVAIACAVTGSLCIIQAFFAWPVGLVFLLWRKDLTSRPALMVGSWVAAALATIGLYIPGFSFSSSNCTTIDGSRVCSSSIAIHHPMESLRFLLTLMGNFLPWTLRYSGLGRAPSVGSCQLLGAAILVLALFVGVQSIRRRRSTETLPLPFLLIIFALLFDLMILSGRVIDGIYAALANRYLMPNLILLTGIAIYCIKHLPRSVPPRLQARLTRTWSNVLVSVVSVIALIALVAQVAVATNFALTAGSLNVRLFTNEVRIAVNLDSYPVNERACELSVLGFGLWTPTEAEIVFGPIVKDARSDHLSVFKPGTEGNYVALGPRPVSPACSVKSPTD